MQIQNRFRTFVYKTEIHWSSLECSFALCQTHCWLQNTSELEILQVSVDSITDKRKIVKDGLQISLQGHPGWRCWGWQDSNGPQIHEGVLPVSRSPHYWGRYERQDCCRGWRKSQGMLRPFFLRNSLSECFVLWGFVYRVTCKELCTWLCTYYYWVVLEMRILFQRSLLDIFNTSEIRNI